MTGVQTCALPISKLRGWNLEDAARRLRYAYLTRTAKRVEADAVVVGHTQNDQAETVLMQLLRGAAYLQGMPAKQKQVARPLLGVSKGRLLEYLADLEQPYRTDGTNQDKARTRAWLRCEIIPRLEARYPNLTAQLAQFATMQRDQADYIGASAARLFEGEGLPTDTLRAEPAAVQREAVAQLLRRVHLSPSAFHIEALRDHLDARAPFRLSLPGGGVARIAYGRLEVVPRSATKTESAIAALPAEVDPEKLAAFPSVVYRTRLPGDRIQLVAGSKKVSDLLIDAKVPREERGALRILASARDALWIEGVATDSRVVRVQKDEDIVWMRLALAQARAAAGGGELPVGAVVVREDAVIGTGANVTEAEHDPTGHAEIYALREAARALGDWRLKGCTLYVTLEPCPMCFGAALQAHLPRLVYGAPNNREGALGGVSDLRQATWKRSLEVRSGVLAREASTLLSTFFRDKR